MRSPTHYLHVYLKPKIGTGFVRRFQAYNYQHTISSMGWFDTASCDIAVNNRGDGQNFVEANIGAFVAIYVDNPLEPIWEGIISRATFNNGASSYTVSIDEMANRVSVVFTAASNVATQSVIANNTASQALYGIKQDQIEFGPDTSAGVATQRGFLRDTILAQRAYPLTSVTQGQGETNTVHLELIGIFHTLEWEKTFSALVTTTSTATAKINALLAALANGSTFFDNTDTSKVTSNTATTIPDQQRGISVWEQFQKIAEAGDATNYWVIGVTPTNPNKKTRVLYYQQFNSAIDYIAYQRDGLQPRNLFSKVIPPWRVTPDHSIRINDMLLGHDASILTDPRVTYIFQVQYDANSQQVNWFGADDTTARAAFLLKRGFKPLSRSLGAPLRTIST